MKALNQNIIKVFKGFANQEDLKIFTSRKV